MRTMWKLVVVCALVIAVAVALGGCAQSTESSDPDETEDDPGRAEFHDEDSADVPTGEGDVLMMGRSVMAGWFEHWSPGWDWDSSVEANGYTLAYRELSTPPDIAESACEYIEGASEGSVVFFKFCFDDCWGSAGQEGRDELADLESWTEEVATCAADRGVTLIVGNALPKVAGHTDDDLVRQHRDYNEWLDGFAAENDGVYVFDQYTVLTDSNGALKSEYAVSRDDSHLNDEAYQALDPGLFELLGEAAQ